MIPFRKTLVCLIILLLSVFSCRYKDGPVISFHSVKNRIIGTWDVASLTIDGTDYTDQLKLQSCYSPFRFTQKNDRADIFLDNSPSCGFQGSWILSKDKKKLGIGLIFITGGFTPVGAIGNSYNDWTILKLTTKKMWLEVKDASGDNIVKFEKK